MTKNIIAKKLIIYQIIAFGILMLLIVGDEMFDFPHVLFGAPATPINWQECWIEGSYILVLAVFSIFLTKMLIVKVKYLEGFIPICSFCRKVRVGKEWQSMERYLSAHSEAELSHGLCPECAEIHYGEFMKKE